MSGPTYTAPLGYDKAYYQRSDYTPTHITADISGKELGTTGAMLSSRMQMTVKNETGKKITGFFTENVSNDLQSLFSSRFAAKAENLTDELMVCIYEYVKRIKTPKDLRDFCVNCGFIPPPEKNPDPKKAKRAEIPSGYFDPGAMKDTNKGIPAITACIKREIKKTDALTERDVGDRMQTFYSFIADQANNIANEKFDRNLTFEEESTLNGNILALMVKRDPELRQFLGDIIHDVLYAGAVLYNNTRGRAHQSVKGNINKRNNAMYDYANLLGQPDLLAKSSSMSLKKKEVVKEENGEERTEETFQHGSFMLNAKGHSRAQLFYEIALQTRGHRGIVPPAKFSGSGLQSLSKLQIMDYLCGNIDRHQDNMFYQYSYKEGDGFTITDVQGIDNDSSFGVVRADRQFTSYMSGLPDIKFMDAAMAKEIQSADFSKIEERLRLANLSAEEIKAAHERFIGLQTKLKQGGEDGISIIEGIEKWNELAAANPKMEKLADINFITNEANIFQIVKETITFMTPKKSKDYLQKPEDVKPPEIPATEISENASLDNILWSLDAVQADILEVKNDKKLNNVKETMTDTLLLLNGLLHPGEASEEIKGTDSLSDMQRNLLVEQLRALQAAAEKYVKESPKGLGVHAAKNVLSLTRFFVIGVQNDAIEKEKNAASYQANNLARANHVGYSMRLTSALSDEKMQQRMNDSEQTRLNIKQELPTVDKTWIPSSDEFKNMMTAFAELETATDRSAALNKLAREAQTYLDYKNRQKNLSDYAKARMAYATRILTYANKAMEIGDYEKDANDILTFGNRCTEIVNDYMYAANATGQELDSGKRKEKFLEKRKRELKRIQERPSNFTVSEAQKKEDDQLIRNEERFEKARNDFLAERENVVKGIEMIERISNKYPPEDKMQTVCYQMLVGVKRFKKDPRNATTSEELSDLTRFSYISGIDSFAKVHGNLLVENIEIERDALEEARNKALKEANEAEITKNRMARTNKEAEEKAAKAKQVVEQLEEKIAAIPVNENNQVELPNELKEKIDALIQSLQEKEAVKEYIANVQRYPVPKPKEAVKKAAEDSKAVDEPKVVKAPQKVKAVKK